jgi:hypothetical protein
MFRARTRFAPCKGSASFKCDKKEVTLSCAEAHGCVVPMHKEIKTGTLAGVLRQAGVAVEDFVAQL